ncbi:MAG: GNAT family N-acetyltransferase [Polaromonas sp.]|nr:GNAT family N-acetyltransferase [Polaromonas sp.]
MQIRSATDADAARISGLIQSLSGPFFLSPDGSGAELFLQSVTEQAIRGYVSASNFLYLIAEAENELAGVVALRDNTHLYHLFVARTHQGKGLGRSLWLCVKQAALRAGNSGRFTVNASLNAIPIYERFGFIPSSPKVEKHGVAFMPMQLVAVQNGG